MVRKLNRIGVFVCHCGRNISGPVDVARVVEEISNYPGVVHVEDYIYMCSDPGQDLMRKAIREKGLTGIVNANCSHSLHERTFRNLVASEGMNPYCCEIANIREQCSWPHNNDSEAATEKAIAIIKATIERIRFNLELSPIVLPLAKRALVIGAGAAGIQSALDIANAGYEVVLVERDTFIGGHAAQLSGTFPTLDRAACLIAPTIEEVTSHPMIKLHTCSEVEEVSGYIGNFMVRIRNRASFVDNQRCTDCMLCSDVCPVSVPSEFERGLTQRKAIYIPHRGATPSKFTIDPYSCLHFKKDQCNACQEVCPTEAIDFSQKDTFVEEKVGAIIAAPGYDLLPRERISTYPNDPDIIDGLQFERVLSSSGTTLGEIRRPSDGKVPEQIVFIQCVGSCDPEHGVSYCSRICCMYVAKQALLYRRAVPEGQVYVFCMDIRSDAKGFEEFVQGAINEGGVLYLKGEVSKVFREGDRIKVWGVDTLSGHDIEISADLVVLALAIVPRPETNELARKLNIIYDEYGFLSEAHIKLRPVESLTAGIYLAGTAQWPRDLPDTIASASAAAGKVLSLFSRQELLHEPVTTRVDEEVCTGCGQCVSICTYDAIEIDSKRKVAIVNEVLCEGCGACAATCPSKAMQHKNWTPRQFFEMINAVT